ncbi:MAG TPA: CheR family methyltransferase [Enterovirga sp.]
MAGGPVVIGIGGSGAALDSISGLLAKLPPAPDQAIVVVLQHREAIEDEALRQALAVHHEHFQPIEDGTQLQGGRIYVAPQNVIVTLADGHFQSRPAQQEPGSRGTIDSFFLSLAKERGERALAIMLSGTAGDGTLGFAAIKEHGGLTVAEATPHETAADLATSSFPVALADLLLPLGAIPEHVRSSARQLARPSARESRDASQSEVSGALRQIATILRNKTGHDFHGYKPQTFMRRVQRRMKVVQLDEIEDYAKHLRGNGDEVQNLFNDLLIGVTQFFRDAKEFEILEREVIPRILEGKEAGDPVRVWVLGCATGEEAYSIAILLREQMARQEVCPHVQIFATDIDGRALASARVGRYAQSIAGDMSPERLARWFVKEGNTYCVVKELREMCIFSAHSVIRDAPFSRLDLVSCRNLLIYLNAELQTRVIPLFHFALLPDRFLFLGNSENVTRHQKLFVPIDRRARIFRRLDNGARVVPEFPITSPIRRIGDGTGGAPPRPNVDRGLARRVERIAERYAPAYVVTDENFQVLHFSGRTGRYIEPTNGVASLDLLSLLHRDLRLNVRAALMKAAEEDQPVRADLLKMHMDGRVHTVDVVVEPVRDTPDGNRNYVVVLKDGMSFADGEVDAIGAESLRDEHVQRLDGELRLTRERLQATIEELESTNEELKSSNEEYQSLNEELQSANEELETSREELQSVNEELTTVNGELAHRVHELTRATSDLKNFLESTQIATLFLDNELNVMNFTPAVREVFHLIDSDLGRPIAHIKSRIGFEDLHEDIRRVQRTLSAVERSLENAATGARYIVRVLPYRSVDNFIAGTVVTFVDVTALTRAEETQRLLLAELQHRVRNTLSVVRSIARRTARTSDTVEEYAMHLDGRLQAFARTQGFVTRNPAAGVDLELLVVEELLAYGAQEGDQASISGPQVRLQPKAAETFGLVVHELATNAIKHGSLSKPGGRVDVSWSIEGVEGTRVLGFEWIESGGPAPAVSPRRCGFGTELLERTLSYELKATASLDFAETGLRCRIQLPLTERIAVGPSSSFPPRSEEAN